MEIEKKLDEAELYPLDNGLKPFFEALEQEQGKSNGSFLPRPANICQNLDAQREAKAFLELLERIGKGGRGTRLSPPVVKRRMRQ